MIRRISKNFENISKNQKKKQQKENPFQFFEQFFFKKFYFEKIETKKFETKNTKI